MKRLEKDNLFPEAPGWVKACATPIVLFTIALWVVFDGVLEVAYN